MKVSDKDRAFLKAGGVFDDDFIDSYIELKMTEVIRFEHTPASGGIRDVLFCVSVRVPPNIAQAMQLEGRPQGRPFFMFFY